MKIFGNLNRTASQRVVYSDKDFAYELKPYWISWPKELKGCTAVGGCCDSEGNLYISTRGTSSPITIFNSEGQYLKSIGQGLFSDNLHGLSVTNRDTLLCTDSDRHVVREIDLDGKLIRDFGTLDKPGDTGFEPDVFKWLVREGRISQDMPFNATFEFIDRFKTIKCAGPPFNKPTRMIESKSGEFFASDGYGNAAIHKFSSDGTLIKTWGGSGNGKGEFRLPHGLWIDKMERLWVADRENRRVQVFTTDGEVISIIDNLIYRPAEIWSNNDNIFIGEVDGGITILDMQMNIVSQIGFLHSSLMAHGLCGDTQDNLYIQTLWFNKSNNVIKLVRV